MKVKNLYVFNQGPPETLEKLSGLGKTCLGCGNPIESKWDYLLVQGHADHGPLWHGEFHSRECFDRFVADHHNKDMVIEVSHGHSE